MTQTVATINLSALQHNLQQVRQRLQAKQKILAMVKADAYGHGAVPVAQALTNADVLGVATLEEALQLRQANLTKPIVVMRGFDSQEQVPLFLQHDLIPLIHCEQQLVLLEKDSCFVHRSVWIKLDTGMHRLGFLPEAFPDAVKRLQHAVGEDITIVSHLADADNRDKTMTLDQLSLFKTLTEDLPFKKSIGNSATILGHGEYLQDYVRPGLMLYGASPFADKSAAELGLKPVMTLRSHLVAVKVLKPGDTVGYHGTWTCPEPMPVGIVGIGYGDGYPRHIDEKTPVLIQGQHCPIVGRVSMDMLAVDLRALPQVTRGEPVILWGEGLPIELIAQHAGTIAYELFTQLTQRVRREYPTD